MQDLEIVELYLARNENAIKETDNKYGKLCFYVAVNILGNKEDAEECVNDTYLGVWNKIPPTRPGNFRAFLCKIARNLSLKRLEYNLAQKRFTDIFVSFSELKEVISDDRFRADIKDEEIGQMISCFLRTETRDVRNVFIRRYWFFDSITDIAVRYSFSESKVKSMLYHSRNKLKKYLKKEGIEI